MIQILVIDDDIAVRRLLQRILTRQGYNVQVATDGRIGLEMAIATNPDLIICDWMMPGISGLDLCKQVKSHPILGNNTFFILLTALGTTGDKVMGFDAGADDFLCKPIEMYELQARVKAALRIQQLTQALNRQKQKLELEFSEAAQYVQSLLPPPLKRARLQIDTCFIPSSDLGGDGFDYFWLDDHRLVFYLLDVSGHGLKAALPSISVINLLRARQGHQGVDYARPSNVLAFLNRTFQFTEQQAQYFTIWYGVFDIDERVLTYASAGHPPAILITEGRPNDPQHLKMKGFPIGMFEPDLATYKEQNHYIPFGSTLYLFSDGVYENSRVESQQANWQAFLELLSSFPADKDLQAIAQLCGDRLHGGTFEDDFSMMKLTFDPRPN